MKILLIGYGKMGQMVERLAISGQHEIVGTIDIHTNQNKFADLLKKTDVAIEFTVASSCVENYKKCFHAGVPVVSGTTGWLTHWAEVIKEMETCSAGFFYASNFSLGVHVVFEMNRRLAQLVNTLSGYQVSIEETHHTQKLDKPSGTAITLAEGIIKMHQKYKNWDLTDQPTQDAIPIMAKREGMVPGKHQISWVSQFDNITLCHEAYDREGFASGAILAAEYMAGKKGLHSMEDLLADNKHTAE